MPRNFKCLVYVKRLFIPIPMHTHTHTHPGLHMLPHTQRIHSLQTPSLLEHQRWVLLWLLHTENPHITYHASFNPRCLRESEGNSTAERNSWTWTTRNRICVGLSAPQREAERKWKTTEWRMIMRTKEKAQLKRPLLIQLAKTNNEDNQSY